MKIQLRVLFLAIMAACAVASAQVTTSPTITGVAGSSSVSSITSGTINGAVIGGSTPAAVTGTTVTATGALSGATLTLGGAAVLPVLSGTSTAIGGSALVAGQCASTTVSVTNSTTAMAVVISPTTYPGDGNEWQGYVSSAGTVTVKLCAIIAGTPVSSTYNVRVIQ